MADIYLKLTSRGVISGTTEYKHYNFDGFYDGNDISISKNLSNENVIYEEWNTRDTASDTYEWIRYESLLGSSAPAPPYYSGTVISVTTILKIPKIKKMGLRSVLATSGCKYIDVYWSFDNVSYTFKETVTFTASNQKFDVNFNDDLYISKFLISSEDKFTSIFVYDSTTSLVPPMTSNVSNVGAASASSIAGTGNDAWKAFDGDSNTQWSTPVGTLAGWLSFRFSKRRIITRYIVGGSYNVVAASAKDWTLEGSNDGSNWVVLDTRTNITGWSIREKREYKFENKESYSYYRINVTANNGNTSYVMISELELYGSGGELTTIENTAIDETHFLKFGMDTSTSFSLNTSINNRIMVKTESSPIGSGKVFKQKIDTTKTPIKKASIT